MSTHRILSAEEVMEIRKRFENGIGSVIIGGKCDCGGQVSEIKLNTSHNLEVVFDFFLQRGGVMMFSFKIDYTMPFGTSEIYLLNGNLHMKDSATHIVIFPSAVTASKELEKSLAEAGE